MMAARAVAAQSYKKAMEEKEKRERIYGSGDVFSSGKHHHHHHHSRHHHRGDDDDGSVEGHRSSRRSSRSSLAGSKYRVEEDGSPEGSDALATAASGVRQSPTPSRASSTGSKRMKRAASMRENLGCYGSTLHHSWVIKFQLLRDAPKFQAFIILVILVAGIQVGIQTYPLDPESDLVETLEVIDNIILVIFIAELVIKFVAEGKRPWLFFNNNWNVFDFLIVVVGLMPFGGSAVTALRLVRLLRVLKLVRALPKLRVLVMGLLKSMSSIAYIGLLLLLLFYLYAVLGVSLWGTNDPLHMESLHISFLTLFRCATLEDWTDVMYTAMLGCEVWGYDGREQYCVSSSGSPIISILYFFSFVVLANMMILNLFIGVITGSMAEAKDVLEEELVKEKEEKERMRRQLMGLDDSDSESDEEEDRIMDALTSISDLVDEACSAVDSLTDRVWAAREAAERGEPSPSPSPDDGGRRSRARRRRDGEESPPPAIPDGSDATSVAPLGAINGLKPMVGSDGHRSSGDEATPALVKPRASRANSSTSEDSKRVPTAGMSAARTALGAAGDSSPELRKPGVSVEGSSPERSYGGSPEILSSPTTERPVLKDVTPRARKRLVPILRKSKSRESPGTPGGLNALLFANNELRLRQQLARPKLNVPSPTGGKLVAARFGRSISGGEVELEAAPPPPARRSIGGGGELHRLPHELTDSQDSAFYASRDVSDEDVDAHEESCGSPNVPKSRTSSVGSRTRRERRGSIDRRRD